MNDAQRHQRARELFEQLRVQPPATHADALRLACGDDVALQAEVARLLAAASNAGSFLEHGAAAALGGGTREPGQRVGIYELTGLLGVGGMGEVYRAHDHVLGREVALKFVRSAGFANAQQLARFRREAQVLAALNHPNIAAIYGVDESEGTPALVLELVEGPTLADRLALGALSFDEALSIARQLTDALEAAHVSGIVHRDLKPANVKLRADGTLKVLDFGLATAPEIADGNARGSQPLSQSGMILGTARCMSPEQARGRPVDRRTDIWAFGCVLFEMLTGKPVFDGADVADTLVAILTRTPDWTLLSAKTPTAIRRLLHRCLEKDRNRRLADIADARLELEEAALPAEPAELDAPRATSRWAAWSVAAVATGTALWLLVVHPFDRPAPVAPVVRSAIVLPERLGGVRSIFGSLLALSPDGRQIVFVASDASGHTRLWLRALDELEARPIPGTQDAQSPFWSADGRWLAFIQDRELKKVAAGGGAIVTLCADAFAGGAWNGDDVILFTQPTGILARVPAEGGIAMPLAGIAANKGEVWNQQPFFLPDGNGFGYVSTGLASVHADVYLATLDGSAPPVKLPIETSVPRYAAGYLWYMRDRTLMAQPLDVKNRKLTGPAVPVAEHVRVDNAPFRGAIFSVTAGGMLVYQRDPTPGFELTWFDRTGLRLGTLGTPADYADVDLSPDATRALVSVAPESTAKRDLWIFDLARGLRSRFTFDEMRPIRTPIWSPDGSRIVFATERLGHIVLMQKLANGASEPEVLFDDPFDKEPLSISPDGKYLLYARRIPINQPQSWVLSIAEGKPRELTQSRARFSAFSPDGRWLAFDSPQSGRVEVYVAPFPGPGRAVQVSNSGGFNVRWRGDGKELFFSGPDNKLMSATLAFDGDSVEVQEVKSLFELPWVGPRMTFDVTPDGERMLALTQSASTGLAPLTLVTNWPALLRK
jgi:Tol biopolymer transport system component/tRNA A-37 threonylcarbamoyl transferase component Bud32